MKKLTSLLCITLLSIAISFIAIAGDSLPWTEKAVKNNMTVGDKVIYTLTGKDTNGAEQNYNFSYEITEIKGSEITLISKKTDPGDGQIYGDGRHEILMPEDGTSQYFNFMRPTIKVVGSEKVTVPAGAYDCTVAELKNMFGETQRVWMINDMPGIYAKVTSGDLTYSLKEIIRK